LREGRGEREVSRQEEETRGGRERERWGKKQKKTETETHVVGQEDLAELDDVRVEQPRVVDELAADILFLFVFFFLEEEKGGRG